MIDSTRMSHSAGERANINFLLTTHNSFINSFDTNMGSVWSSVLFVQCIFFLASACAFRGQPSLSHNLFIYQEIQ